LRPLQCTRKRRSLGVIRYMRAQQLNCHPPPPSLLLHSLPPLTRAFCPIPLNPHHGQRPPSPPFCSCSTPSLPSPGPSPLSPSRNPIACARRADAAWRSLEGPRISLAQLGAAWRSLEGPRISLAQPGGASNQLGAAWTPPPYLSSDTQVYYIPRLSSFFLHASLFPSVS
jgi:hypothetical protein